MFSRETYIQRRQQLRTQISSGILLFLGNEESPMNYQDNAYHFRQDSSFLYYFGISDPGLAAIIDLEENMEIVFGDEMSIDDIVWMGRLETLREKCAKGGIDEVLSSATLTNVIENALKKKRIIHFLPPYRGENKIKLMQLLGTPPDRSRELASVEFIKAVVSQRSIKTDEEVTEIEKAVNISADMHLTAMQIARPGLTENAVAAAVHQVALNGGGNISYPIILTVHGEILHNHFHGNVLEDGHMILNDSGAETSMAYCGDLTRTFPAGKSFTQRQKDIYNIVLKAKEEAAALLKPGMRFLDVHIHACRTLVSGLKDLGLMKGDTTEAVAAGAHTMFFQCGLGHMMGMDVHDMEDLGEEYVGYNDSLKKEKKIFGLKSLRLGKELQDGYVLTVEPGVYIIPDLIDLWKAENKYADFINYNLLEQYRDFGGIRIEDNYVITSGSSRLLGKHLAKTVEEVEEIRKAAY